MKTTLTFGDFVDFFRRYDRYDQFGYEALRALFDYLEEIEEDTGEEIEMDVIALCCDYTVFEDLDAFRQEYGDKYATIEDVEYETTIIRVGWNAHDEDGPFIVLVF